MTNTERLIASILINNYHEKEESYPYTDYRRYINADDFISSQDDMTDVLFVQLTIDEETDHKYIQVFLSSKDDMAQDFVYFDNLTEEEQNLVSKQFLVEYGTELASKLNK